MSAAIALAAILAIAATLVVARRDQLAPYYEVVAVAFSPSGEQLVSVGRDGYLRVFDANTGAERSSTQHGAPPWLGSGLAAVAWSGDGALIALAYLDGVQVFASQDLRRTAGPRDAATTKAICLGEGGNPLYGLTKGGQLQVLDLSCPEPFPRDAGGFNVRAAAFSADCQRYLMKHTGQGGAGAGTDAGGAVLERPRLEVFATNNHGSQWQYAGKAMSQVDLVALGPSGNGVIAYGPEYVVQGGVPTWAGHELLSRWAIPGDPEPQVVRFDSDCDSPQALAIAPDEGRFAIACDGEIRLFDAHTGALQHRLKHYPGWLQQAYMLVMEPDPERERWPSCALEAEATGENSCGKWRGR